MTIHILMAVRSLDPATGGPARSVPLLSRVLLDEGFSVEIYTGRGKSDKTILPLEENKSLVRNVATLQKRIQKLCSKSQQVIVHNHGLWLPFNHKVTGVAARLSVPLVHSPRGMLEPWALGYRGTKKKIAWELYQKRDINRATVLHATSAEEAVNLRHIGITPPIAVVANGVSLPTLSRPFQQSNENFTALFLSRLHPKKGLLDLVDSWKTLSPKGWKLIIAGPDELNHGKVIQKRIEQAGLAHQVSMVGELPDAEKWSYYATADLFVLPTYSENFGIVIAEALGSGLPVITTNATPWREIEEFNCGWWIDCGCEHLTKALAQAINMKKSERHAMGARGRRLIEDKYCWTQIGKNMSKMYQWIVDGGHRPQCILPEELDFF